MQFTGFDVKFISFMEFRLNIVCRWKVAKHKLTIISNFLSLFSTVKFWKFSYIPFFFLSSVPLSDILLRLGEYDISHENEPLPFVERRVQIVASHPQFDRRTFEYDLALLRFYEPVTFQKNVLPACVPSGNNSYVGKYATVTGWGRLYEGKYTLNLVTENNNFNFSCVTFALRTC